MQNNQYLTQFTPSFLDTPHFVETPYYQHQTKYYTPFISNFPKFKPTEYNDFISHLTSPPVFRQPIIQFNKPPSFAKITPFTQANFPSMSDNRKIHSSNQLIGIQSTQQSQYQSHNYIAKHTKGSVWAEMPPLIQHIQLNERPFQKIVDLDEQTQVNPYSKLNYFQETPQFTNINAVEFMKGQKCTLGKNAIIYDAPKQKTHKGIFGGCC